ncbi:MAG: Fe-S cluster assembly protein SufD [Candidatus Electryonea clarkiae]|nr:Fe-S cluster assembly protein SufD [Candidatus Electryonea clarkiae]MDP8285310.1 Fe-S cluster assembly protein SufD [Candidatus Electryonea clarkiae]
MNNLQNKSGDTLNISGNGSFRPAMKDEPKWLHNLRKEGWNTFNSSSLPGRIQHLWRYTDPKLFMFDDVSPLLNLLPVKANGSNGNNREISSDHSGLGYNRGDRQTFTQLENGLSGNGIIFQDLFTATLHHSDLIESHLGKLVGPEFGKFEAFNHSLWNTGYFLFVPKNVTIEKPVYLHRHPTGLNTITRLLVILEENAEVTLIDDYACHCGDENALVNGVTEIFAGAATRMKYVQLQRLPETHNNYQTTRAKLERDSSLTSVFLSFGGETGKVNTGVQLSGSGAESNLYGMLLGANNQHFDHHTVHHHDAPDTSSNLNFKVSLSDHSQSAYTGLIKIDENSSNCQAYQENRNLLLDPDTKAESIPELEIINDQVSCSHGVTVGSIDPDILFYLQSRGIDSKEAVKMVVEGFYEPVLEKLPVDIQELARNLIDEKLNN